MLVFWNNYSISCARNPARNGTNYERAKVKGIVGQKETWTNLKPWMNLKLYTSCPFCSQSEIHRQSLDHLLPVNHAFSDLFFKPTFRPKEIFFLHQLLGPLSASHWIGGYRQDNRFLKPCMLQDESLFLFSLSASRLSYTFQVNLLFFTCSCHSCLWDSASQPTLESYSQSGLYPSHSSLGPTPTPNSLGFILCFSKSYNYP